jgi:hypothetical protein
LTPPLGGTVALALVSADSRAAAIALWDDHLRDVAGSGAQPDSTLFEVIEGEGDYLLVHEFRRGESGHVRVSFWDSFDMRQLVDSTTFSRIYASADARALSRVSRLLFLARVDVARTLDHDAFNDWYDSTHVPDVAAVGLRGAQRFRSQGDDNDYLASYEIAAQEVLTSDGLAQVRGFHQFTSQIRRLRRTVARQVRTSTTDIPGRH